MQQDIYGILVKIKSGEANQREIRTLFQIMFNIAKDYLKKSNKNFIFNTSMLPEDAAMEVLTPLFVSNNGFRYQKLLSAFDKWTPEIRTHKDALFFLHQLVFIRSEHHLINLLRRNNPGLAAFINSINNRVKENEFEKQVYGGTLYLTRSEITPGKFLINTEEFNLLRDGFFLNQKQLPESLFTYLTENNIHPSIPYYLLLDRVNKLNWQSIPEKICSESGAERILVDEAADEGLSHTIKKLKDSYSSKNKLNNNETIAFNNALQDIRTDLTDGGVTGGYFEYLQKYMPDLSHPDFKAKYENIFEYLVKILKQETIKVLKEQ